MMVSHNAKEEFLFIKMLSEILQILVKEEGGKCWLNYVLSPGMIGTMILVRGQNFLVALRVASIIWDSAQAGDMG